MEVEGYISIMACDARIADRAEVAMRCQCACAPGLRGGSCHTSACQPNEQTHKTSSLQTRSERGNACVA